MLFWGYITARIVVSGLQPSHHFIDSLPFLFGVELTFLNLGIMSFLAGLVFFLIYAWLRESQRELEYLAKIRLMDMAKEDYPMKEKEQLKGREIVYEGSDVFTNGHTRYSMGLGQTTYSQEIHHRMVHVFCSRVLVPVQGCLNETSS
jgi:hypothetical protein